MLKFPFGLAAEPRWPVSFVGLTSSALGGVAVELAVAFKRAL